jgi:hypothetical protein
MIDYGLFKYAAPPRTASTWVQHALSKTRHEVLHGNTFAVHIPFSPGYEVPRLSTVRHPVEWLLSYWYSVGTGVVSGCDELRELAQVARRSSTLVEFLLNVAEDQPGIVGRIFGQYMATSVIRVEDLPYGLISFLQLVGDVPPTIQEQIIRVPRKNTKPPTKGRQAVLDPNDLPQHVWRKIMRAEEELSDRYEYF